MSTRHFGETQPTTTPMTTTTATMTTTINSPTLTLITPLFQSVIYAGSILSLMLFGNDDDAPDATTLEGVVTLFKDPNIVFVGWIHYIVFDLLVARMEVLDSIQRGASITVHILVVIPCMIGTFMLGPFGFLAYMMLRQIFLPETPTEQADAPKMKIL